MHLDHLPGTFLGPSNLVELLRHRARCQPNDLAFVYLVDGEYEEVPLTYRELDRQARAIGSWLEAQGLVGERALLLYPPGLEFIAAFFGCLYAGVVAVPVYPPRRNRSLERIQAIADDADAKVALTTDVVLTRVLPLIDETPHLKQLVWKATCQVEPGTEELWTMPDVHGDTLAFLQYTSGSTGTPKGVVLNHANLMHNSALIGYAFEHTRSRRGVFWLPSYHDMGLIGGILQPLYVGRPNILMSPMSFLQKPYRWLSAITRYKGTTSGGPNFAYELCVQKITAEQKQTLDLSTWKVAFNGAEPVRAETLEAFTKAFAPCGFRPEAFYPCFGLAEATLLVSGGFVDEKPIVRHFDDEALKHRKVVPLPPNAPGVRALVGCGQNLPDQIIVIANPDTHLECPPQTIGEIWVHGPSMAQGYWQNKEATETTFHARLKDTGEGPFMRTGDLGFMQNGELFVTGRLKDLIIVRGVNYYPQDIEMTMYHAHPRLRPDAGAAFTLENGEGEQFVLAQEVDRGRNIDLAPIFASVRKAVVSEHELEPDAILLLKAGSIPKTSSGKIQRHACRSGYLDGSLETLGVWRKGDPLPEFTAKQTDDAKKIEKPATESVGSEAGKAAPAAELPEPHPGVLSVVLEEINRIAKDRAKGMTLDSPIVETGMDSLERMEIVASLEERFGGRLPEDILPELETTRQVVTAVEKYLGTEPRARSEKPAAADIPEAQYRIDQFPEYIKLRQNLDILDSFELGNPFFIENEGISNNRTIIGGRSLINYSNYNYVGTSGHPEVIAAAQEAAARYGTSASASRLVSGHKTIHTELEKAIARFLGVEDAIVMVGGHATNESVIGHLTGPGDLILHDALAHNSIVQGSLLSGSRRRPFAHNDWSELDRILTNYRNEYRRVLIAIEGVYSMDGDFPNLPKFIEVKKKHKAMLFLDEAHSLGVMGPNGRGLGEYFGVARSDVDLWMGTLSKSFGSCGGFIAGQKTLADYLRYTLPGFVFAAAMPPPAAAAALASIGIMEREPERFARLHANSALFLRLCQERGMNTGMSHESPIIPVILGNSIHCLALSQALKVRGVSAMPILYPAVEESAARLRFFLTSEHTDAELRETVDILAEELAKLDPKYLVHKSER